MSETATPAVRLRRFIEAKSVRPDVIVYELEFGPPAPELRLVHAGRLPRELLDFVAEMNGLRFEWQSRIPVDDPSVYTMDGGGISIPDISRRSDWHNGLFLIDEFPPRGVNTYYRRMGHDADDTEIGVGQPDVYPGDWSFLCRTLDEFVTLAIQHDLQLGWADDLTPHVAKQGRSPK